MTEVEFDMPPPNRLLRGEPPARKSAQDSYHELDSRPLWSGCKYPERPHDRDVRYHDCCTPCMIAAQAAGLNIVDAMRARLEEYGEAEP